MKLGHALFVGAALWLLGAPRVSSLPVLYDFRIKSAAPSVSPSLQRRVFQNVLRIGAVRLKRNCYDLTVQVQPRLVATARGSFTRKGAAQTAYFVQLCETKRFSESGFYGVAVYEEQRLMAVFGLQIAVVYSVVSETYAVRDIDLNGLDELAFVRVSGDGCCSERHLALLELRSAAFQSLGELRVAFVDGSQTPALEEEWVVSVARGVRPALFGVERTRLGKQKPLTLQPARLEVETWFKN